MSESINSTVNVNANPETPAVVDHAEHVQEQQAAQEAQPQEPTGNETGTDKEAQKLLRKTVDAFAGANRDFVLGRVRAGMFACEYVQYRRFTMKHGRALIVKALAGRLAELSDTEEDADPNRLMKVYQCVRILSGKTDPFKFGKDCPGADYRNLSWGKLLILSTMIVLNETDEAYSVRPGMSGKDGMDGATAAQALFAWACGTADERPSRTDIQDAVQLLVNPEKAAAKKAAAADTSSKTAGATDEKPATVEDAGTEDEDEDEDEDEEVDADEAATATECVQANLLKAAAAGTAKDVASMAAELIHGAEDGTEVVRELSRLLDWSPDMAVAIANGIMDVAPKSARALYLALRNLMNKAGAKDKDGADSNGATDGATVSA